MSVLKSSRAMPVAKGPVTLTPRVVPDEWQVEHGYAEMVPRAKPYIGAGRGFGDIPEGEPTHWARLKPGTDVEKMIYHSLTGKPAKNYAPGTPQHEQFSYRGKATKADRAAAIQRLVTASSEGGER